MLKLYITRHGETIWNTLKRMQGHKDSELTQKGRQQAAQLAKALESVEFEALYSSSSGRTMQTAQIITGKRNVPIIPMDSLKEINLGKWEGMVFSDVERKYPVEYRNFWEFPHLYEPVGGENLSEIKGRLEETLRLITQRHDQGNVLIVTHAVSLKFIMLIVEQKELKDLWNGAFIHPTSLSMIEYENDGWKVVKWGDISHYDIKLD
ncbi:MAG: histidine phosphatase family protein [Clostridiaceae bacterium]|nr:histidine phosphatase family protein [Clostridiaceae bacterium]